MAGGITGISLFLFSASFITVTCNHSSCSSHSNPVTCSTAWIDACVRPTILFTFVISSHSSSSPCNSSSFVTLSSLSSSSFTRTVSLPFKITSRFSGFIRSLGFSFQHVAITICTSGIKLYSGLPGRCFPKPTAPIIWFLFDPWNVCRERQREREMHTEVRNSHRRPQTLITWFGRGLQIEKDHPTLHVFHLHHYMVSTLSAPLVPLLTTANTSAVNTLNGNLWVEISQATTPNAYMSEAKGSPCQRECERMKPDPVSKFQHKEVQGDQKNFLQHNPP